jgi:hypothetical protein
MVTNFTFAIYLVVVVSFALSRKASWRLCNPVHKVRSTHAVASNFANLPAWRIAQ